MLHNTRGNWHELTTVRIANNKIMKMGLCDGEGFCVRMFSLDVYFTTGAYIIMGTIPKVLSGESISNNTFSRNISAIAGGNGDAGKADDNDLIPNHA